MRQHPAVQSVAYPGLADHPDHALAQQLFLAEQAESDLSDEAAEATTAAGRSPRFGHMLAFHLRGNARLVDDLIQAARQIEFCPSLGEVRTTLSHPASTSHRSLSPSPAARSGIRPGTVRLSLGIESGRWLLEQLRIAGSIPWTSIGIGDNIMGWTHVVHCRGSNPTQIGGVDAER